MRGRRIPVGSRPFRRAAARSGPAAAHLSNNRRCRKTLLSPSPPRSSIAPTGFHPPAMNGRSSSSAPLRPREIFRRLSADGSFAVRSVRENCHHEPSMRATRPSFSIALRIFWLTTLHLGRRHRAGVAHAGEAQEVARKLRSLGMENEGPAHSQHAAEKAGLEHDVVARRRLTRRRLGRRRRAAVVQSSCAKTNAAKSTSRVSSSRRSSVDVPGLKDVIQGSTLAMSLRPRVSACSNFSCFPDEPKKSRGLSIGPSKRPPARHFQHAPRIPSSALWHLPRARAANRSCQCNGAPASVPWVATHRQTTLTAS